MRNLDFTTFFEGRIVNDVRLSETNAENTNLFFTVAIDNGYKNKQSGEWVNKTRFVECMMKCRTSASARIEYLTKKLLVKGYKVKGCGAFSEPQVDMDKNKKPFKGSDGKYKASIILFVDDIKLVARPNGNPVPTDKPEPTVQAPADDLPF